MAIYPNTPAISVIMIDGLFRESFHAVDFFATQTLPPDNFELLWVEYYDKINPKLKKTLAPHDHFRSVMLGREGVYHSSYCFNAGIRESRGDLLVIPDADVVVEKTFLEEVWKEHQANEKLVMYIHRYNEPHGEHDPEPNLDRLKIKCRLTNPANYGGCLTVRKKWLLEINGYEQHPVFATGDHANGRDVYTRLKNLGLHVQWHPELKLYHPWHEGTLASALTLALQQMIIDRRALSLSTKAFQGIDPLQDEQPPADLMARIEAEKIKRGAGLHEKKFSLGQLMRSAKKTNANLLRGS